METAYIATSFCISPDPLPKCNMRARDGGEEDSSSSLVTGLIFFRAVYDFTFQCNRRRRQTSTGGLSRASGVIGVLKNIISLQKNAFAVGGLTEFKGGAFW